MNIDNNKIEVGEYVRTNDGIIDKVKNNDYYMQQYIECEKSLHLKEKIIKHSKNIIDLIEVGDYVNGEKILDIRKIVEDIEAFKTIYSENEIAICVFKDNEGEFYKYLKKEDIEDIVTKEQFNSVKYEIKED